MGSAPAANRVGLHGQGFESPALLVPDPVFESRVVPSGAGGVEVARWAGSPEGRMGLADSPRAVLTTVVGLPRKVWA